MVWCRGWKRGELGRVARVGKARFRMREKMIIEVQLVKDLGSNAKVTQIYNITNYD